MANSRKGFLREYPDVQYYYLSQKVTVTFNKLGVFLQKDSRSYPLLNDLA